MPHALRSGLRDKEPEVYRNSAFLVGVLCRHCAPALVPLFPQVGRLGGRRDVTMRTADPAIPSAVVRAPGACARSVCLPDSFASRWSAVYGVAAHQVFGAEERAHGRQVRVLRVVALSCLPSDAQPRDNALSAVAKLVLATQGHGLPMKETVALFCSGLPLQRDWLEAEFVYGCVVFLFSKHPQTVPAQRAAPRPRAEAPLTQCAHSVDPAASARGGAVHGFGALSRRACTVLICARHQVFATELVDDIKKPLILLGKSLMQQLGPQMTQILQGTVRSRVEAALRLPSVTLRRTAMPAADRDLVMRTLS